ncbi:solute carrier family 4 member 11-like [Saccoglossus kowalevskii]
MSSKLPRTGRESTELTVIVTDQENESSFVQGNGHVNHALDVSANDVGPNETPSETVHRRRRTTSTSSSSPSPRSSMGSGRRLSGDGVAGAPVILSANQTSVTEIGSDAIGVSLSGHNVDSDEDEEEVTLMYAQHEKVPMKDFSAEVRAVVDVEKFLSQAVLLLDVHKNTLEGVVDLLLTKAFEDESETTINEAKSALFTHDSVHSLARSICNCISLTKRHVAIARLKHPANFGRTSQEVHFVILVLAPTKEKSTKNALETGRTFSTIFADMDFRHKLIEAKTEEDFKKALNAHTAVLSAEQNSSKKKVRSTDVFDELEEETGKRCSFSFASGLRADFWRRIPHYWSDYKDGVIGHKTPQKSISTTFFLYFAILLPSIAFGVLNDKNTNGAIDVKRVIVAQGFGGLFFALFGGQPLIILLTTAPLALFINLIYVIAEDFELNFYAVYACVGIWNSFFLLIYSVFGACKLMKWSTRSTEEIFALFIAIAFCYDAFIDLAHNFDENYVDPLCNCSSPYLQNNNSSALLDYVLNNGTDEDFATCSVLCTRENSLLYLILLFGTVWLGLLLYNFTKSPYLDASKRELLADYALPVAVIIMSFIGSFCFRAVDLEPWPYTDSDLFAIAPFQTLSPAAIGGCAILGFPLSLLFFMDQNISSALVNAPQNKLKKGSAYNLDLLVVAFINFILSIFGLPWIHAALPHSPLHVRALADVEERVDQGHVHTIIVHVRETRLTAIISHIFIALSLFLLPLPLQYIPQAVLYGLFLYVAFTSVDDNQMFDRICLFVTEQAAYPPNHYVRRVPQRKIHTFTILQLIQLTVLCIFGFVPQVYLRMLFPVVIMLFMPTRFKLVPLAIEKKYLEALDKPH